MQLFTYTFDTTRNYLPTQVIRHHDDGSFNVLTELSYEEVIPGKAWFVRAMTQSYFMQDAQARRADSDRWHQRLTHWVARPIRVNEDIPDEAFEIELPAGVRLSDSTR